MLNLFDIVCVSFRRRKGVIQTKVKNRGRIQVSLRVENPKRRMESSLSRSGNESLWVLVILFLNFLIWVWFEMHSNLLYKLNLFVFLLDFVLAGETVQGFDVFKSSKSAGKSVDVNEDNDEAENGPSKKNKELNRQLEVSSYSMFICCCLWWCLFCFLFVVLNSCYNFNFFIVFQRDSLSRKKYNIHVSGNNVATPLQNFDELSSRYSFLFIL